MKIFSPNIAEPHAWRQIYRGDARRITRDIAGAMADFERAIKLDPRFPESYLGRGTLRIYERDFDGAIADFTTVLTLDRRLAQAYRNRGYAYFLKGNIAEAEKDFGRAVAMAPRFREEIDMNIERMNASKLASPLVARP